MSGDSVSNFSVLSEREDASVKEQVLRDYSSEGRQVKAHLLSNASVGGRKGPCVSGFVVEVPLDAPADKKGIVDKSYCGCLGVFDIHASNDTMDHMMQDTDELVRMLQAAVPLGTHNSGVLSNVGERISAFARWNACVSVDSPDALVAICVGIGHVGTKTVKKYQLVIRTNLRSAVSTILREFKERSTSVGDFVDSEKNKALENYTALNVRRLAFAVSVALELRCDVSPKVRGMWGEEYTDACVPSVPLLLYNVLAEPERGKDVAWMFKGAYRLESCRHRGSLVVETPMRKGFIMWYPTTGEVCEVSCPKGGPACFPIDMGLLPSHKRLGSESTDPEWESHSEKILAFGQTYPVKRIGQEQADISHEDFNRFVEVHGLGKHGRSDLNIVVAVVSTQEDRHIPLCHFEEDAKSNNGIVSLPIDHKFNAFLLRVYAKAARQKNLPKPSFELKSAQIESRTTPGYFDIEREVYESAKELVLTKKKYERALGF